MIYKILKQQIQTKNNNTKSLNQETRLLVCQFSYIIDAKKRNLLRSGDYFSLQHIVYLALESEKETVSEDWATGESPFWLVCAAVPALRFKSDGILVDVEMAVRGTPFDTR